jgi:superfamily II DNA/RNA helicase
MPPPPSRDDLASRYFDQLPYPPYPVQESALLAWFTSEQGVLVCAPTGTGKTLIAEAALFEALHTNTIAYYTTPLIALTEQKFMELQNSAVRWGFSPDDIGLVTGNRRVNPQAKVLVVVAEILLNRLLHPEAFSFDHVSAVVMDEFHSFADIERGIVWELSLAMLPPHVRTLLLSATVGNAFDFSQWLQRSHQRRLELVQGTERKVPLEFRWVGDQLLNEQLEIMADGDDVTRYTPALVFCFNREECWNVAEQIKGKQLLASGQQVRLGEQLDQYDWSQGAGPKLKQLLFRGVGVHHAGLLPKYRRIVEALFQQKLLSICVCTETLSAGINLPARSVVLPTLLKGKRGEMKVVEASSAHQIFGRAGRPQFDSRGYVFAIAHEDDVKILRWREKFNQIPEDTKDPGLLRMKKELKRKMPTRRSTEQYWTEQQFEKLRLAPPGKLYSKGALPWRLLAYMLSLSPDVQPLRKFVGTRLMDGGRTEAGQRHLDRMLLTLWKAGYVRLEPEPPTEPEVQAGLFSAGASNTLPVNYEPLFAYGTPELQKLVKLRGVHPLYGVFLVNQLGIADSHERIQALESLLEMPGSMLRYVRVPRRDVLPPGPLSLERLDPLLVQLGLATAAELGAQAPPQDETEEDEREQALREGEEPIRVLTVADKLKLYFDYEFPGVHGLNVTPCWAVGEVLEFAGNFNKYITSKRLQKQEGVIFRHLLRFLLLIGEFEQLSPPEGDPLVWRAELSEMRNILTECCHHVDPTSTDQALEEAKREEEIL